MSNAKKPTQRPTWSVNERTSITERPERPAIDANSFAKRRSSMIKKAVKAINDNKAAIRKSSNTNRKGKG